MEPREIRPAIRVHEGETAPFEGVDSALERHRREAQAITLTAAAPPKLAKMLLPGEHVRFGTSIHPIVLVAPAVCVLAVLAFFGIATFGYAHMPAGAWLRTGAWPVVQRIAELGLLAASLGLLVKRTFRFLGLRVVATNRRIFAIRGVIVRRITPLGNAALAASTLSQGVFGRMFGYGSIDLPLADGTPDRFRDVRDAVQLYREFQAVAHGVDGDDWKPAVRQTLLP
jgi:hypothetical protein